MIPMAASSTAEKRFLASLLPVVRFGMSSGLSFFLTVGLTVLCHEKLGMDERLAFAVVLVIVFAINFTMLRLFVFRTSEGTLWNQLASVAGIHRVSGRRVPDIRARPVDSFHSLHMGITERSGHILCREVFLLRQDIWQKRISVQSDLMRNCNQLLKAEYDAGENNFANPIQEPRCKFNRERFLTGGR